MNTSLGKVIACSAVLGLGAAVYPVGAHHATSMFDHATTITLTGTVSEVHWTNPHVAIYVNGVVKEGEAPATWVLEMTSPGNLVRAGGWTRNSVKPGMQVSVDMSPLRDGKRGAALKKITLPDGKFLTANLRLQEQPNLEPKQE